MRRILKTKYRTFCSEKINIAKEYNIKITAVHETNIKESSTMSMGEYTFSNFGEK